MVKVGWTRRVAPTLYVGVAKQQEVLARSRTGRLDTRAKASYAFGAPTCNVGATPGERFPFPCFREVAASDPQQINCDSIVSY